MQMKKEKALTYNKRVTQVIASIIWFSILYSLMVTIFSRRIVLLLYGKQYLPAVSTLQILVWSTLFDNLTKIRDLWLIGENQSKFVMIFSATGTISNVIMNYFMIQSMGILGAAIATVLTQTIVTLFIPYLFSGTRQYSVNVMNAILLRDVDARSLAKTVLQSLAAKRKETPKES
jgi:O-antigen/teichoic acid export membrane protein